jgi:hypothetical protein
MGSGSLRAEAPDMMAKMYLKLCSIIQGPKPDPRVLVSMANPGLPIPSKGLDPALDSDMVVLQNTLDTIPTPTAMYGASLNTYTSVYDRIMRTHQVNPVPMSAAELAELTELQALVKEDSPKMIQYCTFRDAWEDSRLGLEEADGLARASGKNVSDILRDRVVNNLQKWDTDGHRPEIESALERIRNISNKSGLAWWNELNRRFQKINSPTTLHVETFPKPQDWGKGGTWTNFTFSSTEAYNEESYAHKDVEAAANIHYGKLTASGSGSWSKTEEASNALNSASTISFDLKRVAVYRPWLEGSIFSNTTWNLTGNIISNGATVKDLAGDMPLILNQIILCKNLKITGSWVKAAKAKMEQDIKAKLDVTYGPFSLSAAYNQKDKNSRSAMTSTDESISAKGVQIIGFVSTIVPKAPNYAPAADPKATEPVK